MGEIMNLKKVFGGIFVFLIVFLGVFALNVFLHELGHYAGAESFGLNPQINIGELSRTLEFSFESKPIASTSFTNPNSTSVEAVILIMGLFMNLLLCSLFLVVGVIFRKNRNVWVICVLCAIVSLFSFLTNIIPFDGTDGSYLWNLIN